MNDLLLSLVMFLTTLLLPILGVLIFMVLPILIFTFIARKLFKREKYRIARSMFLSVFLLTPVPIVHSMGGTFMYASYAYYYYFLNPSFRQDGVSLLEGTWYIVLLGVVLVGSLSFLVTKLLSNHSYQPITNAAG